MNDSLNQATGKISDILTELTGFRYSSTEAGHFYLWHGNGRNCAEIRMSRNFAGGWTAEFKGYPTKSSLDSGDKPTYYSNGNCIYLAVTIQLWLESI